jgi:hypothetical protein
VLARQDYFDTEDRIMYADIPIKGIGTTYGFLGEWFVIVVALAAAVGLILTIRGLARRR